MKASFFDFSILSYRLKQFLKKIFYNLSLVLRFPFESFPTYPGKLVTMTVDRGRSVNATMSFINLDFKVCKKKYARGVSGMTKILPMVMI